MAVTIQDVADAAQVSIATVSKIINQKPSISDATRQKVLRVMEELNYRPSARAVNFARQSSENIVFLAVAGPHTAFHNPHLFEILCGAQRRLSKHHYNVSFIGAADKEEACRTAADIIGRRSADGILIHGSATSRPLADLLTRSDFPHIIIGRPPFSGAACWIDINNHVSGEMATKYLTRRGYSRIAFIGGPATDEISRHRLKGFTSAMQLSGHTVPEAYIKYGSYSKESGFAMMKELLSLAQRPDAVICENNPIAMGAASAVERCGLHIPDDLGLITFDDYPLSQLIDPPLTVVDIDVNDMGVQAASLLLKKIRNPEFCVQSFCALPSLIIRSSTR